ncbi:MAG TPA: hypothetical protein VE054_15285, partial [Blattabacteriaceae bacterium]|nr:hypothetical protein [Blattabacteriaceae bacterium]
QTIQKIIAYDLDLIEHRCDAIVCYWDQYAGRGAGTQGELTFAHRMGIPVYLICGVPVEHISGWLLGCATEIFTSFEQFNWQSFQQSDFNVIFLCLVIPNSVTKRAFSSARE